MVKEDIRPKFDFAEALDRARDLQRELFRSRSGSREVEISVLDDPEVLGDGTTAVPKCQVTVKADTLAEAKAAKSHLEGKDHKCKCTRDGTTVKCTCP